MLKPRFILIVFYLTICSTNYLFSQIKVISINKLNLPFKSEWSNPVFSPDSRKIFFTNSSYNGIWEYDLASQNLRQITNDKASGYNFSISDDGEFISYRRTSYPDKRNRLQEVVIKDLKNLGEKVLDTGGELSTPTFVQNQVLFTNEYKLKNPNSVKLDGEVKVLGIELTKIALLIDGKKVLLDPFGKGSYIWPSLSPDKKYILAYEMQNGAFISDLSGNIIQKFGKKDAPVWSNDGKFIFYMNDKDDGHKILSSDIMCISVDGKYEQNLTNSNNIHEMYPNCSPGKNLIVCNSIDGDIILISYEVAK